MTGKKIFRHDRLTGHVALGLVGALCAAAVVFGVGVASAKYHLADVGGWLTSTAKGELVHVNGLSGKVDGKVKLTGAVGHPMKVVQQGGVVLVVDEATGVVSRVDPAHLNVVQGVGFRGAAGMEVVSGPGAAYALDQPKGSIQRLDPLTLATMGGPLSFTAPLGAAAIDARSALWVPVPSDGQAATVHNGQAAQPIGIGRPGDDLALTIAAGVPVITDFTSGQSVIFGPNGAQVKVRLPSIISQAAKGSVLAPASTDGQLVPLLAGKYLVVLNSENGSFSSVSLTLPDHQFAAPQALDQRIYIPDQNSGKVLVYDATTDRMERAIQATGRPGSLEAFVKDGLLWVNDPDSANAVVIDGAGGYKLIKKYSGSVPGNTRHPLPLPKPVVPGGHQTHPHSQPDRGPNHRQGGKQGRQPNLPVRVPTLPPQDPPVVPPPGAPTDVRAMAQPDGTIEVDFQPGGGPATGFKLITSAGLTATPPQIGPDGPLFSFTVSGGTCGTEYEFAVSALYQNGDQVSEVPSGLSAPTQPCTEPDAPSGVTASGTAEGAKVSWQAPPNAATNSVTYAVDFSGTKTYSTSDIRGTSITIPEIFKNGPYTVAVTASNAAGAKTATTTRTLTGPPQVYDWRNVDPNVTFSGRTAPSNSAPNVVDFEFISGKGSPVTANCETIGDVVNYGGHSSSVWVSFHYQATTTISYDGYVTGIVVGTPNPIDSQLEGPPMWECAG
jgi:hypothetical protein